MGINKPDESEGKKPEKSVLGRRTLLKGAFAAAILRILNPIGDAKAEEPCRLDISCQREMDQHRTSVKFNEAELEIMQRAQEMLYRTYLNPDFLRYMEETDVDQEKVDKALEMAIRYPDELHYHENTPGVVTITNRHGSENIPNGFSMRINIVEIGENERIGEIREINGIKLDSDQWADWETCMKIMDDATVEMWNYSDGMVGEPGKETGYSFEAYNIKFPHRLARLLKLRNQQDMLNPNEESPNSRPLKDFLALLKAHPRTKKEWDDGVRTNQIYIYTMSDQPNTIFIFLEEDRSMPFMAISPEGYIMTNTTDGYVIPGNYTNAIKNRQKRRQNR